jgi:fatty-acyl-CoA synthase
VPPEPLIFDAPFTIPAQLDARAAHPTVGNRVFLQHEDRAWTYRQYRAESIRMAHFLRGRLGRIDDDRPGHVAMFTQNHLEVVALYGGCAYAALTLFGINTGLRGDVLAGVFNQSRARVLVVDERFLPDLERIRNQLTHIVPENILVLGGRPGTVPPNLDLAACLETEVGKADESRPTPSVDVQPAQNQMVIYTSGTTGLPKGINNDHLKLCLIGAGVATNMGLTYEDVGYACMPFFHSNSIFLGLMPALWCGGGLATRERFSAGQFVPDVFRYGVTFWNYVGEPVHYVLAAIEKQYGADEARITAEITHHPHNRLRYAVGNGAAPPDIERFIRWLGLEDVFELYGSTEAAISTFRRKGDPRGSVGEITDPTVRILNDRGAECPPAEIGPGGQILNGEECVGEICRAADAGLFQGYFDNPEANDEKYRKGVYHSGDLGHVLMHEGKRYLFFDGRTDDWIRKDGENFSAAQVARAITEHPDVALAVAYGVPCPVSDELVMVAMKMRARAVLDPQAFFNWCCQQIISGSMNEKWFPDFVRVVDDFEYTPTEKILVRNLKKAYFDRRRLPDAAIYWRRRGETSFRFFTSEDYATLRAEFAAAERLTLLDR